jgi:hypothetical protein
MRTLILVGAALLIGTGFATAQQQQAPETTGQAPSFEDRWAAQREIPDRPPAATKPDANASSPGTTGQAPREAPADPGNGNWVPPAAPSTTGQAPEGSKKMNPEQSKAPMDQ